MPFLEMGSSAPRQLHLTSDVSPLKGNNNQWAFNLRIFNCKCRIGMPEQDDSAHGGGVAAVEGQKHAIPIHQVVILALKNGT